MIDSIMVGVTRWINLMADRNTTQKDPNTKKVIEKGMPRCRSCTARMSVVETQDGKQRLWCFHCESPLLGG